VIIVVHVGGIPVAVLVINGTMQKKVADIVNTVL
jgi:hypothetical protein